MSNRIRPRLFNRPSSFPRRTGSSSTTGAHAIRPTGDNDGEKPYVGFWIAMADCGGKHVPLVRTGGNGHVKGTKPTITGRRNNRFRTKSFLTRPRAGTRRSFGFLVLPSVGGHHVVILVAGTLVLVGPAKQRQYYSLLLQSIGSREMRTRVTNGSNTPTRFGPQK